MKKVFLLLSFFLTVSANESDANHEHFIDEQLDQLDVEQIPLDESIDESYSGLPPEAFTFVKKGGRALCSESLEGGILIEGDLRSNFAWGESKEDSKSIVKATGKGHNLFTQEYNLYLNYFSRRSKTVIQLQLKNKMGSLGGSSDQKSLQKAYFNYDLYLNGPHQISLTLGRRPLSEILDSKLQFKSRMDGLNVNFLTSIDSISDFDLRLMGSVVDFATNQFAYFAQLGVHNICNTNLYFKYSFSGWKIDKTTRIFDGKGEVSAFPDGTDAMKNNPRFQFNISQLILGYTCESLRIPLWFYGAMLYNHSADPKEITENHHYGLGYYFGLTISKAENRGDFSIDINYQYLPPQVVPDFDISGINNGNARSNIFYGPAVDNLTGETITPATLNAKTANGNVNFQGVRLSTAYVITEHLTLQGTINYSKKAKKSIGPDQKAHGFLVRSIYTF